MSEYSDENDLGADESFGQERPETLFPTPTPRQVYLKVIDRSRWAVAIAMAVCGLGLVICARCDNPMLCEPGPWAWGVDVFGCGVLVCLIAVFGLIVERLTRPSHLQPLSANALAFRLALALLIAVAAAFSMVTAYGPEYGFGTIVGVFLSAAAVRQTGAARAVLLLLATVVFGLTFWDALTAYRLAI